MPEPRRWTICACPKCGEHSTRNIDPASGQEYCDVMCERPAPKCVEVEVVEARFGGEPSEEAVLVAIRKAICGVLDEWGDFKAADHPTIAAMAAKAAFRVGRSADHAVALRAITALSPRSREEAADAFEEAREIGNAALASTIAAVDAVSGKEGEET